MFFRMLCLLVLSAMCQAALGWECDAVTDVPASECQALKALASSTQAQNWHNNQGGWVDPAAITVCDAWGVTCSPAPDSRVISLDLGHNGLEGIIPAALSTLSELTVLKLNDNAISGTIPAELGDLSELRVLELWTNNLSGSIPPELGNLHNLEVLDLRFTHLTGSIPPEIGGLTNLRILDLDTTFMEGPLPPELGNLIMLEKLALSENQFNGPIPEQIGNLGMLKQLFLSANNLTGEVPASIGQLENLESLILAGNRLYGMLPESIENLADNPSFTNLLLFGNCLDAEGSTLDFVQQYDPAFPENQHCEFMVDSVLPSLGPATGGTLITIRGMELDLVLGVRLNNSQCIGMQIHSNFEITCQTPPGPEGFVDILINTLLLEDTLIRNGFQYLGEQIFQDRFSHDDG